jgi:Tol biopolymer transport system component/DNA-binding winged helix-turn-helix (wHTH) protein
MVLEFPRGAETPVDSLVPGREGADFRLAGHLIQTRLNRIQTADETLQVEPKVMQVLVFLAENAGEVISRETLIDRVWEGAFVSDDVLTRCIGELRKIFHDDPASPRIIETIRKGGYRLIAPIEPVAPETVELAGALPSSPQTIQAVPRSRRGWWLGIGIAALSLVAVLALVVSGRSRQTAPERQAQSIRVLPLTSSTGNEIDPAVAPDGSRVVYGWQPSERGDSDLFVQLVDGGSPLQITEGPGHDESPVWSPDGTRVGFVRWQGEKCHILLVSALGGATQTLGPCGDPHYDDMDWSPDGRWLAFAIGAGTNASPRRIRQMDVDTLERRFLTTPPADYFGDHSPAISPDGRTIAFARALSPGVEDLYVAPVEGGEARRLTTDNRDVTGLDWSGDGESLFFSSDRAGTYNLWEIPVDGGELRMIAGGGAKIKDPSVSVQGATVAFESWIYEINIWQLSLMNESDAAPSALITSTQWDYAPAVSPNGTRLAFSSTRSGSHELWIADSDGSSPTQLTSFAGPWTGMPNWSPDGEELVFVARPAGQADLYVVSASGAPPRRLTSYPGDEIAPSWSRDGRSLYFGSRRSGAWEIWRLDRNGGQAVQVTTEGGYAAVESPDGEWLLLTKIDQPGIWRLPLGGGEEELLVQNLEARDWANWTVSANRIYYLSRLDNGESQLAATDLTSGETTWIAHLDQHARAGLSVSPDGERLYYSRTDRRESDVMVARNLP